MFTSADHNPAASSNATTGRVKMPTRGSRGFRRIKSASGGSTASANAGKPVRGEIDVENLHGRQRQWKPRDHGARQQDDLADVTREQIHQVLLDVSENDAPLLDRCDDRREVVVEQGHSGGFLAHIGSGDAHRDADVRLLQGWRIVDAVSGHRHDLAAVLPGLDDAELVRRRDAREHRDPGNVALEVFVAHRLQIPPGDHAPALEHPELSGDRAGRQRMITGDHHRLDACGLAGLDGGPRFVPGRVHHRDQAEQGHLAFCILDGCAGFHRDGEHTQALAGHALLDGPDALAAGLA